jgi:hypothetical protein
LFLKAGTNEPEDLSLMTYMKPIVEGEGEIDLLRASDK